MTVQVLLHILEITDPYSKVLAGDFQQENMIATLTMLFGVRMALAPITLASSAWSLAAASSTAVGHLEGEEGIENLARAFLMAGSQAVISTLWPIDDTYSLFLMKRFYTHIRDGVTESEALRLSQTELLGTFGKDTAVANWAAFTLLGDGDRTIVPQHRTEASSR